jgi:hypothetical protein
MRVKPTIIKCNLTWGRIARSIQTRRREPDLSTAYLKGQGAEDSKRSSRGVGVF